MLSLHDNGNNSYLFVNRAIIYQFKAKDYELVAYPLSLGSISKGFSVDKRNKTGLNGYVYDFSVGFGSINVNVDDILDIHK